MASVPGQGKPREADKRVARREGVWGWRSRGTKEEGGRASQKKVSAKKGRCVKTKAEPNEKNNAKRALIRRGGSRHERNYRKGQGKLTRRETKVVGERECTQIERCPQDDCSKKEEKGVRDAARDWENGLGVKRGLGDPPQGEMTLTGT